MIGCDGRGGFRFDQGPPIIYSGVAPSPCRGGGSEREGPFRKATTSAYRERRAPMKLYVDLDGDRHYLLTDDGEAVYVDDLKEEGRDTEMLDRLIESAKARRKRFKRTKVAGSVEVETFGPEEDIQA